MRRRAKGPLVPVNHDPVDPFAKSEMEYFDELPESLRELIKLYGFEARQVYLAWAVMGEDKAAKRIVEMATSHSR